MSPAFPTSGSRVANEQSNVFFIVCISCFFDGGVMLVYVCGRERGGQANGCVFLYHAHGKMTKQPVCNIAGRQVASVLVFSN